MTSNIGSELIQEIAQLGFTLITEGSSSDVAHKQEVIRERITGALRERFKPEFLNRVDEIIIFNALTPEDLAKIVDLQIEKVQTRTGVKNVTLKVTQAAKKLLAVKGYDPNYGARPLARIIQQLILDPLAKEIIDGKIKGGDIVTIDAKDESIKINSKGVQITTSIREPLLTK